MVLLLRGALLLGALVETAILALAVSGRAHDLVGLSLWLGNKAAPNQYQLGHLVFLSAVLLVTRLHLAFDVHNRSLYRVALWYGRRRVCARAHRLGLVWGFHPVC